MKIKITWGPWEWAAWKPTCLFCVEKATQAAKASHGHVAVSIRCCAAAACQALALDTCKQHLGFMVGDAVEAELLN